MQQPPSAGHVVKHASGLPTIWQQASGKQIGVHVLLIPCSVLDLSYNVLKGLSASISELLHLRVLLLDHNELEQLPEGLEKCQCLTRVDVSYNKLTGLPGPWAQLPALQRIVAANNQLRSIPVSFGQLRQLKELDLRQVQPTCMSQLYEHLPCICNRARALGICITQAELLRCHRR